MSDFYLPYQQSRIHGVVEGHGEQLLFCFHGFGESAAHFRVLTPVLGDRFTLIALDMPLHGETEWKEDRPFEKDDLQAVITLLLQQYGKERFSVMGYSMGGRVALCAVERMADRIDHLLMLAADGLRNNPWHMFVTQTSVGNKIFKYNTHHPELFFTLLGLWRKLGLLNESIYKFAFHRMDKEEKRWQVYEVWTCMRKMMPDKKRCKRLLAKYNVHTLLIFGRYDRVIPPILGTRFMDGTFPAKMLVLERGHQLLSPQLGEVIMANL